MPTYTYQCSECEIIEDKYSTVSKRDELKDCSCGGKMEKQFALSLGVPDSMSSLYPFTRKFGTKEVTIYNRREKLKVFREHGLHELPVNYSHDGSHNLDEY